MQVCSRGGVRSQSFRCRFRSWADWNLIDADLRGKRSSIYRSEKPEVHSQNNLVAHTYEEIDISFDVANFSRLTLKAKQRQEQIITQPLQ